MKSGAARTMVDGEGEREREREREREKDTLVLTAERRSRRQDNATQRRHSDSAWQMSGRDVEIDS